jgi:glycosyltransferase involved in cell wall biosynthesis
MGGLETWIASVSKELMRRGHEVDIITGAIPKQPKEETIEGLRIKRIDWKGKMASLYTPGYTNLKRQFAWLMTGRNFWKEHKNDYDIVHPHVQGSLISALLGVSPKKIVWSWHGTYHKQVYQMYPFFQAAFYDIGEHIAIKLPYAACITADKYTKKLAVKHMWANPKRIFPIANGVDIKIFKPMKVKKPSDWPDGFHIVSTRRLVIKTGLQFLIPALRKIIEERKDVHLMIYGDGPLKNDLIKLTNNLNLKNNVHFMGPFPYKEMPRIYNAADLIVIPSLIEATSISCLEAMACGKLLITCPVGGVPEIAPSNLVIYSKPVNVGSLEDALEKAIFKMSDNDRKRIGNKARKHIEMNFTWEKTVDNVLKVYDIVLRKY